MKLAGLLQAALADPGLARARDLARAGDPRRRPRPDRAAGAARRSSRPRWPPTGDGAGRPVLAVTATSREAEDLAAGLGELVPAEQVAVYPAWETLPHERLSPRSRHGGPPAGRAAPAGPPGATAARLGWWWRRSARCCSRSCKGWAIWRRSSCAPASEADLEEVVRRLVDIAYARVDLVTKRGEFAVRGGILDVFPPTEEHPLRVEFWGDEVEEIRSFAVADQRTIAAVDRLWAPPCRELLLTADGPGPGRGAGRAAPGAGRDPGQAGRGHPGGGHGVAGARAARRQPARWSCCCDCMPDGTHVLLCDPERIRTRAHDLVRTSEEFLQASWAAAAGRRQGADRPRRGRVPDPGRGARGRRRARHAVVVGVARSGWPSRRRRAGRRALAGPGARTCCRTSRRTTPVALALAAQPVPLYHGETARVVEDLKRWVGDGWRVVLVFEGHGPAAARGRGAARRRPRRPAGRTRAAPPEPGELVVTMRRARARFRRRGGAAGRHHRQRHHRRPGRVHKGHAQDAEPAAQHHRPAGAARRRLRGARAARHRPLRRAGAAHGQRRRPGVPGHRVRAEQARPARRPAVRADRPLDQLSRYVGGEQPDPAQDGRLGLAEGQGPGAQGGHARSPPS